jgi:hypothetical protein
MTQETLVACSKEENYTFAQDNQQRKKLIIKKKVYFEKFCNSFSYVKGNTGNTFPDQQMLKHFFFFLSWYFSLIKVLLT